MPTTTHTHKHLPTTRLRSLLLASLIGVGLAGVSTEPAASPADPAPAPMATIKAKVDGGLDREAVRSVVKANIDDVRECYNTELLDDPDLGGEIVVDFTIEGDGTVRDVSISESTMPARFDACLSASVEGWLFSPADAPTSVRYPFAMSAA